MSATAASRELLPLEREPARALYVHVPFCVRRCHYCDFATGPLEEGLAPAYLRAITAEAEHALPAGFSPRTIFIGGGTPTELPDDFLAELLALIRDRSDFSLLVEWTVEANPGTLTPAKVALLREAGVTRLSLGVQSTHDHHLRALGRIHTADEAFMAYHMAREGGIENVSLDLILGVPGSSLEEVQADVERFLELRPDHVSAYGLTYEDRTNFKQWLEQGKIRRVLPALERRMFAHVRRTLRAAGYRHYEVSNFCQPGRAARHNMVYWRNGSYIGLGPSAASHTGGRRRTNVRDLPRYVKKVIETGGDATDVAERLEPDAKAGETLVLALRRARGVRRTWLKRRLGFDPLATEERATAVARAADLGLLEDDGDRVRLTGRGLAVADSVLAELL